MKDFFSGFGALFSLAGFGSALAVVALLVFLIWAGYGPNEIAGRVPSAPWRT